MVSSLLALFLNRPAKPFFSSPPKPFSSTTSLLRSSPTSPRSLLRTLFRAFSEKLATFFWAAAPYCRIMLLSRTSILWENSSTAFLSSSVSSFSSISTGSIFFSSTWGTSGASGFSVRVGISTATAVGSRVSSGVLLSAMMIVPFFTVYLYLLFAYKWILTVPARSPRPAPPPLSWAWPVPPACRPGLPWRPAPPGSCGWDLR